MKKPLTEKQQAAVRKMRAAGMTIKDIAKELRVSDKRVAVYVGSAGLSLVKGGKASGGSAKAKKPVKAEKASKPSKSTGKGGCGCSCHGGSAGYESMFEIAAVHELLTMLVDTLGDVNGIIGSFCTRRGKTEKGE